ncbi:S-adenosyl-L-methionine-dependent methyltransferase [Ampelomyces quisqualis]|uniref:S-adenosyl-L-methionine-dependent methyltransferase n=1 Tax=Ampelomyces quisqualis TaxID=50730 RepID=A0A6A5R0M1_AMPQU|nr:S-adenosyl-L-methionine-dependent methyltransferase [Ampelomyces quisqualis]
MRFLSCVGVFKETEVDTYDSTPLAKLYISGEPLRESIIDFSTATRTMSRLPDFFAQNGYKSPTDTLNGPFQFAEQTSMQYWDWLAQRPDYQHASNIIMGLQRRAPNKEWYYLYPIEQRFNACSPSDLLVVDIGGGLGQEIIGLKQAHPQLKGRLILEDRPNVVDAAKEKLPPGIEIVGHDFFQPHPPDVHGAKAYYMRAVLHDWPDNKARVILENITVMMTKDSVLLLEERVLPDKSVGLLEAQLDWHMMVRFSSHERTKKQWVELLESVGLELLQIWERKTQVGGGDLIEAKIRA